MNQSKIEEAESKHRLLYNKWKLLREILEDLENQKDAAFKELQELRQNEDGEQVKGTK